MEGHALNYFDKALQRRLFRLWPVPFATASSAISAGTSRPAAKKTPENQRFPGFSLLIVKGFLHLAHKAFLFSFWSFRAFVIVLIQRISGEGVELAQRLFRLGA